MTRVLLTGKGFFPFIALMFSTVRPLQNAPFCSISASGSNFNPRNTQCIPVVKIIAFLELKQKLTFFKGLKGLDEFLYIKT
jgi:hypothetical protein